MACNKLAFAVPRGDRRQEALCRLLRADGHAAVEIGSLGEAQVVGTLPDDAIVVAPSVAAETAQGLEGRGIRVIAYQSDESCVLAHALITAENALEVAMARLDSTLGDRTILVIGHGRIGRGLAGMLRGLGCNVAVSARRPEDLTAIAMSGHRALHTDALEVDLPRADLVFNTAPALVLPRERLELLPGDALVIDLASAPGGVDYDAVRDLGLRAVHALALPGKLTPLSSARVIRDTVYRMLTKEGLL